MSSVVVKKSLLRGSLFDEEKVDFDDETPQQQQQENDPETAETTNPLESSPSTTTEHRNALRPFVIIASSYLLFTITDGAIRMIVLFQAYTMRFSALQVSFIFVFYELAGVFTNLLAGLAGAKWVRVSCNVSFHSSNRMCISI
jgi:hypothetical protein